MSYDWTVARQEWPLRGTFTISRGSRTVAETLMLTVRGEGVTARSECVPYKRYGESLESVEAQVEGYFAAAADPTDRAALQGLLPAGAARNLVDCALWDLECKLSGKRHWEIAGLPRPGPVVTVFTLSLDEPAKMEAAARESAHLPLLKVKLGGEGDIARLEAVRRGAPDTKIVVDANEGWSVEQYAELAPVMVRLGVAMVEQPLPAGADDALGGIERPLPVCADESCHDRASLPELKGKYDIVNIKLDKTGGLTEALALKDAARAEGYGIMVGCMMASSLAMAPAVILAQGAEVVDLDGPLWMAEDAQPPLKYDAAGAHPPEPELWG